MRARTLHSGFSVASTAHDVLAGVDLSGETAIVTGGYLGAEAPWALSEAMTGAAL